MIPQGGKESAVEMLKLEQAKKDRGLGRQMLRHVKDLEMMEESKKDIVPHKKVEKRP